MYINRILENDQGFCPGLSRIDNRKFIWPAVVGAVGALAGGIGSSLISAESNRENNLLQQKLVKEQNDYNTPINQVARLRAAGLNPFMLLGQTTSGNQSAVASTNASDYSSIADGAAQAGSIIQQASLLGAQVKTQKATAANLNSQTANTDANTAIARADLLTRRSENLARINLLEKQGQLTAHQAENMRRENELMDLTWDERIKAIGVQNRVGESTANKNDEERRGSKLQNDVYEKFGEKQAAQDLRNAHASYQEILSRTGLNGANSFVLGRQANILKHEGNVAYWDSRSAEVGYRDDVRRFKYDKQYYRSPINDRNWHRAASIIPFVPGYSHEARGAVGTKRMTVRGFK